MERWGRVRGKFETKGLMEHRLVVAKREKKRVGLTGNLQIQTIAFGMDKQRDPAV